MQTLRKIGACTFHFQFWRKPSDVCLPNLLKAKLDLLLRLWSLSPVIPVTSSLSMKTKNLSTSIRMVSFVTPPGFFPAFSCAIPTPQATRGGQQENRYRFRHLGGACKKRAIFQLELGLCLGNVHRLLVPTEAEEEGVGEGWQGGERGQPGSSLPLCWHGIVDALRHGIVLGWAGKTWMHPLRCHCFFS